MSSLVRLLSGIVDYAGLFPPAGLAMDRVVSNYSEYLSVSQSWMLGRLVVPAMKLGEFEDAAVEYLSEQSAWRISGLVPPNSEREKYDAAIARISEFNQKHSVAENGLAIVDAVEIKAASRDEIDATLESMPANIDVFFELNHRQIDSGLFQAIQSNKRQAFAKIRTGGVTPDLIPSTNEVAEFIRTAASHQVGMKATAGLHHPIRSEFALTYEDDAPHSTMHGFVNVFAALGFAYRSQMETNSLNEVLAESDPSAFKFGDDFLQWREFRLENAEIEALRHEQAISFGSCSFVEPIQDLQSLGFGSNLAEAV